MASENNTHQEANIPTRSFSESFAIFIGKMLPWLLLIGCAFAIIIAFYFSIKAKQHAVEKARKKEEALRKEVVANIKTWKIEPQTLINDINLPGIIQPWENLILESEVSGKIVKINKDEGDIVKQGEAIAHIDDRDYKSMLAKAKANIVLAKQNLDRTKSLKRQGAVPQAQLDSATSEYDNAKAAVETAQHNLERCTIRAPFSGVINKKYIALGTLANAGAKIIELVDLSKVKVDIGIPENDFDKVRDLKEAKVIVSSLDNKTFIAKKEFLSVKPIEQALVYTLRLRIDNKNRELVPGMFVEANIVRDVIQNAIVVPLFAVIARDGETFCYLASDGKALRKDVTTGIRKGRFVEVKSGLEAGENLIVIGQRQIEDSQKINIVEQVEKLESLFE